MTFCRMTVQALDGVWQGEVDSWTALVVLAALSAEPESLAELAEAVRRYQPQHELFEPTSDSPGDCETDVPWCLVDLTGSTVVAGGNFELPDPRGAYETDEDEDPQGFPIVWLDTPPDWLFRDATGDWRNAVAARASARSAIPRVDTRVVLFGQPLLEHLAEGVLTAEGQDAVDEQRELQLTRGIHSSWLMTLRPDLAGRTPREVLLAERDRLDLDLQHRQDQWSRQRRAAPPLPADSTAYRLGGFGTIEIVHYFELVRALLAHAWKWTRQNPAATPSQLAKRLAEFRDAWLRMPNEDSDFEMSPEALIESERRRMPIASDDSPIDDDCPICQSIADGDFGPGFVCYDGHRLELEDEFAFSLCATRAEWDKQQEDYRRFAEECDRRERERAERGDEDENPIGGSAWQASFVDWDSVAGPNSSPWQALLALGFLLAELTGDLQHRADGLELMQMLNRAYGDLRASQDAVTREATAQSLRELLETVSHAFPDLTAKCADLQSRLDEVLRRLS